MKGKSLAAIFAVFAFVALVYAGTTRFKSVQVKESLEVLQDATFQSTTTFNGSMLGTVVIPTVNVAVSTPTVAGQMVQDSSHVVYIATGTANPTQWQKVGTQS